MRPMFTLNHLIILGCMISISTVCHSSIVKTNSKDSYVRVRRAFSKEGKRFDSIKDVNKTNHNIKNPSILGGVNAPSNVAAYLAYVRVEYDSGSSACTGVVVGSDKVLTNAHCFDGGKVQDVKVWVGYQRKSSMNSNNYFEVSWVDIYEDYLPSEYHSDVAAIDISGTFPKSQKIAGISRRTLRNGKEAYIAGYGRKTNQAKSSRLLWTTVSYYDFDTCYSAAPSNQRWKLHEDSMYCFGSVDFDEGGHGGCSGDSGAPIFYLSSTTKRMWVYGLHTFRTNACGAPGRGKWAMKLKHFRKSILEVISDDYDDWTEVYYNN